MATTMTPTERLRAAAVLVEEVVGVLNDRVEECEHCGRWEAVDPTEHKAHDALEQVRAKLLLWAETLYLPRDQRQDSRGARKARARRAKRAARVPAVAAMVTKGGGEDGDDNDA
jgi:hypothetical protein